MKPCAGCKGNGQTTPGAIVLSLGAIGLVAGIVLIRASETTVEFGSRQSPLARVNLGGGLTLAADGLRF